MSVDGPSYLVTPGGTYRVHGSLEADDMMCVLTEMYADRTSEPLRALSRQQVVTLMGRGLPSDFPAEDLVTGDPGQGGTRGWWESTVQRYLAAEQTVDSTPGAEGSATATVAGEDAGNPVDAEASTGAGSAWATGSRQWHDVDLSGADHRVLLATSLGLVTPSGLVKSAPLRRSNRLGEVVCRRQWAQSPNGPSPQVWITGEALVELGFPLEGVREDELTDKIGDFFGATVGFHQSGWFACEFDSSVYGGETRKADIILMPYLMLDPSTSRPDDRGLAGIQGSDTELPDDETAAAHLLGDRIAWLYSMEGTLPASRWTMVGAQLLEAKTRKAKPKPKNGKGEAPELKMSLLPKEITPNGRLDDGWWNPSGAGAEHADHEQSHPRRGGKVDVTPHRRRGNTVDVKLDQQAAYLPSAEGLYLGYGEPSWVPADPAVFNDARPPFGVYQVTTPAGRELDLHRKLPLPHPAMDWDTPQTWWATTADVQQLTSPMELGGAGIAWPELHIEAAWVWPEQHQWLKGFGKELRAKRVEATTLGREDYEQMAKAIYTSTLGRMSSLGDSAWKFPYFKFTQPAWYAAIEAVTRARAMKYATRIARDHDLYPIGWWADAWYYRVPADFDVRQLEDPLRNGVRVNGSYRIESVEYPKP